MTLLACIQYQHRIASFRHLVARQWGQRSRPSKKKMRVMMMMMVMLNLVVVDLLVAKNLVVFVQHHVHRVQLPMVLTHVFVLDREKNSLVDHV